MYKNITHIVAGFMIVMCLVMCYYLAFTDFLVDKLYGTKRQIFIVLLVLYGAYRSYRLVATIKKEREEK
jgi:cytochrome c biogenesis protein CcdA